MTTMTNTTTRTTSRRIAGVGIKTADEIARMEPEARRRYEARLKEVYALLDEQEAYEALKDYGKFAERYLKIVDKSGATVPLIHNDIQRRINERIEATHAAGRPVRLIILKARQEGVSTNEQGRMMYNCVTKENSVGLIVAHTSDATGKIFSKAKYMYDMMAKEVKPLRKKSNATELVFDVPTGHKGGGKGLNSKITIQTAGDVGIGRGDTVAYAHLSEFGFWQSPQGKSALTQLAGIMAAVPALPHTEVVIESTANGLNDFYTLWTDAQKGGGWDTMFFAWWDYADYRQATDKTTMELIKGLDNADAEEYITNAVIEYGLTAEQVAWWVWQFKVSNKSDLALMKQEYPSCAEEAFIFSGTPIFNNDKVQKRITVLRQKYAQAPPKRGYFTFDWEDAETENAIRRPTIRFREDKNGHTTIYEYPQENVPYVIGGDTKGESANSDKYAAVVINNVTGNRAAVLHGNWTHSKPYTWQVYCLGWFYQMALIAIEMNFNTAPIEELERLHYPRQYQRRRYDDMTGEYKAAHGWKTDGNTRPLIIDKEIALIENNIDLFNDITMLQECLTFVRDAKGRPDAMPGKHDDVLFADMIASEVRRHQSFEAEAVVWRERGSFDRDTEARVGATESRLNPFD